MSDKQCVLCGKLEIYKASSCRDCYDKYDIKIGDKVFDCMYQDPPKYPIKSVYTVIEVINRKDTHPMQDPTILKIDHEFDDGYRESLLVDKILPKFYRII